MPPSLSQLRNSGLNHLASGENVTASTQNQAFSALRFLYRHVVKKELGEIEGVERAKRPSRLPLVLTRAEVKAVLSHLKDTEWLMASLLYGAGLRLMECLRLRVKDLDFSYYQVVVRDGKGQKDRVSMGTWRHLCGAIWNASRRFTTATFAAAAESFIYPTPQPDDFPNRVQELDLFTEGGQGVRSPLDLL
ncbi:MAG: phage integrase N-terminal SAM-like domain-containing protein [Acidobacteriota bacterium]